jgi:hypothetical protein
LEEIAIPLSPKRMVEKNKGMTRPWFHASLLYQEKIEVGEWLAREERKREIESAWQPLLKVSRERGGGRSATLYT